VKIENLNRWLSLVKIVKKDIQADASAGPSGPPQGTSEVLRGCACCECLYYLNTGRMPMLRGVSRGCVL